MALTWCRDFRQWTKSHARVEFPAQYEMNCGITGYARPRIFRQIRIVCNNRYRFPTSSTDISGRTVSGGTPVRTPEMRIGFIPMPEEVGPTPGGAFQSRESTSHRQAVTQGHFDAD
jgi:hypothetical protein